jgi:uncharacterized protein YceH (UPF0502 family)
MSELESSLHDSEEMCAPTEAGTKQAPEQSETFGGNSTPSTTTPAGLGYRLSVSQARVLGALVEKEVTTPDYYPLSLNALMNACNQRTNREPVTDLDEDEVRLALRVLEDRHLAGRARGADGRVVKYEHWLGEAFNFSRAETALICVLLLRGPQTPGELRGRTERLHRFDEISDVLGGLQKLMERTPALVTVLARQPGTKESRYAHLLSGPVDGALAAGASESYGTGSYGTSTGKGMVFGGVDAAAEERIAHLEAEVALLRQQVEGLQQKIDDLFGD